MRFALSVSLIIALTLNVFMIYAIIMAVGVSGLIAYICLGILASGLALHAAVEDWS